MKRSLLSLSAALCVAAFSAFALTGPTGAAERGTDHAKPNDGDVTCMAIGHCPEPPPRERCDLPGNCESPPFCEDGADFCVPPMPPWCDEAGNCEPPQRPPLCDEQSDPAVEPCTELPPGCEATVEGDVSSVECLPPWCDPSASIEDCSPEPPVPPICDENSDPAEYCVPPRPPFCEEGAEATEDCIKPPPPPPSWCEDGSEVCVPPMPPWCDEAGNCEPPICLPMLRPGACFPPECDPAETNPKFCRPSPEDPIVCVMGWPSDEPMPDCPGIYPPPMCGGDGVEGGPAPMGRPNSKFRGRPLKCPPPPPMCEPTDPGATDPGEGEEGSGSEPGYEGESVWKYRSDEIPAEDGDGTVEDPLPCIDPPVYGCFEDEAGNVLCIDPPVSDCREEEDSEGLIACYGQPPSGPETTGNGEVKRNNKGKKAKAKARARAKKAKAAKIKKAKIKKAKAKARR